MSREEFERALLAHAHQAEAAVLAATTRIEHVRSTALAQEARRLADVFTAAATDAA